MSPHRFGPLARLASAEPTSAAVAVTSGVGALLWSIVTGYQLVLLAVVLVVQGVDLWMGADRARVTPGEVYDREKLYAGVWKKIRRSFGSLLLGGCVDVVLLLVGRIVGSFLALIGADDGVVAAAQAAGSLGLVSATALAGLFVVEAHSAWENMKAADGYGPAGVLAGLRMIDSAVHQAENGMDAPTRRHTDVALADLQEDGLAPPPPPPTTEENR